MSASPIQDDVDLEPSMEQQEEKRSVEKTSAVPRTPLPKVQLFTLLLIQLGEPVVSKVIFPFVNTFVRETGITGGDERKTGYFGGKTKFSSGQHCILLTSR
jgi:hypothetical protein